MNKNEKILKKYEKNKLNQKRTMEPFLCSKKIKINKKKISKYLKISLMLFFKRGFARLGSVLHIFLDHRKSQKKTKNLKKSPKKTKHLSKFAGKKQKKTRKKTNKLTQPYNNFAEASGRIAAQLSAVIILSCVVECWASRVKGFKTHLLVTWCIAMHCLITPGRSHSK